MGHVAREKDRLQKRLKRLAGQIQGLERAVEAGVPCIEVLQQATSCRGALDGFIAQVIEDHIREHMGGAATRDAAEDLVEIVHQYLRK
jgi:FrmR/RcnR family transcriptional regulator, repressor of frmRAB operon